MKRFLSLMLSALMLISVCAFGSSEMVSFIMPGASASELTVDVSFTPATIFDENGDPGYYYVRTVNGEVVPYISIGKQASAMAVMDYATVEELIADRDIAIIYEGAYMTAEDAPEGVITEDTEFYLFNFVHIGNYQVCLDLGYTVDEILDEIYCYLEPTNDVAGYYHANVILGDTIPADVQFYLPRKAEGTIKVPTGSYISFIVVTEPMYNVATAEVHYTKGGYSGMMDLNINKEYVLFADEDISVRLIEKDEAGNSVLLRSHFNILMPGGDGFKLDFMKVDENDEDFDGKTNDYIRIRSQYVYYGDDFYFRIKILSDYTGSGMSVYTARGKDDLSEFIGEDMTSIRGMLGDENVEQITSCGVDDEGNLLYHVTDVTSNVNISVSGVNQSSFANVLTMLKRILKMILDALGIDSSRLGLLNVYDVTINCDNRISSCVVAQGSDDAGARNFQVMSGTNVAILITKAPGQNVTVKWTPGNETGTAFVIHEWAVNGNGTEQATFYIDNITANTTIDVVLN